MKTIVYDFKQPRVVSDVELEFTASVTQPISVTHLMPKWYDIPQDFKDDYVNVISNKWRKWQNKWFLNGLNKMPIAKNGIDIEIAMRHLMCIQESYEPKHEHKQAAVAYLASLWFEEP